MDHKAYEDQMIETINRHGEAAGKEAAKVQVITGSDSGAIVRGLKRTLLALLTAVLFVVSIIGLIVVASTPGYLAVLLFFASVFAMLCSTVLLYAQGIAHSERQGEGK